MENFDFITGLAHVQDHPVLRGPVINSRRQLWSVAGYLSMVQDICFGLETSMTGIRFRPFITAEMRGDTFAASDVIELHHMPYRHSVHAVRIHLPPVDARFRGAYAIGEVRLNGSRIDDAFVPANKLRADNRWEIHLRARGTAPDEETLNRVNVQAADGLYAPLQPEWVGGTKGGISRDNGRVTLRYRSADADASEVVFNIYRDGRLAAEHIRDTVWVEGPAGDPAGSSSSYTVEAVHLSTGLASHPAPFIRPVSETDQLCIPAAEMKNRGGSLVGEHHFENWGLPAHELLTKPFTVNRDGRYMIQATYSSGMPINTGITCGIKVLDLLENADGQPVAEGYLIMPHTGSWERWALSSPLCFYLEADREYRLRISENEYARNMSYLKKNERYTLLPGGGSVGYNFVNVAALRIDLLAAGAPAGAMTRLQAE
jgi:hypothetical protein